MPIPKQDLSSLIKEDTLNLYADGLREASALTEKMKHLLDREQDIQDAQAQLTMCLEDVSNLFEAKGAVIPPRLIPAAIVGIYLCQTAMGEGIIPEEQKELLDILINRDSNMQCRI